MWKILKKVWKNLEKSVKNGFKTFQGPFTGPYNGLAKTLSIAYVWNFETNLYFPQKVYNKTLSCSLVGYTLPWAIFLIN